ncbi:alpha-galactosidase [Enterococcus sp. PF1-24]|uniref:alpha-galactosidase n=1 Tax=unclassified Enterococcus TaxID=2608891 RepID=UPI00247704DF|nr:MULTISPECIES: alpha-galactosidase [unclassified Enterococcus]MDH6364279.1 alpha-galactosidase [Enterococcus sp. PFB1-1]MDH6401362.1 alpha-galactosidase [Enterococcus sp. PF1-24]
MAIDFNNETKQFHLQNDFVSYIMEITAEGYLLQVYYGEKIKQFNQTAPYPRVDRSSFSPNPAEMANSGFSLDNVLQEFPGYDAGDYREGMAEFTYSDGTKATSMKYKEHHIFAGKKKLTGLPATYVETEAEADSLEIVLEDEYRGVQVVLAYTIFKNYPVITKAAKYVNRSEETISLDKAFSSCLDLPDSEYDLIQLPGAWAREKQLCRNPLTNGQHVLNSKRGASGVVQQPFLALVSPETNEHQGEVRAFHFVYSGNFTMKVEVDTYNQTRVLVGINDFNFTWQLAPAETFQTPEVVMVYSNQGLNGMSQAFHHLYRERLARGIYRDEQRPVLINNWETTYFDFNEEKLVGLAEEAQKLGVELFVLDDGWFGERHSDTTSLGDWVENREKLPEGLAGLRQKIQKQQLKFGLWLEPEMISEESQLFAAHPDWHLHVAGYPSSLGRNQLILDFSREEVRAGVLSQLTKILDSVPISYIKWDMNRNMTEVASAKRAPAQQQETAHRYMLGLYAMLEELTSRYPQILFENCSGGGGRFDPGMCYYMPQSWASDNTDAIERLKIQYSTSLIFPPVMMCAQLSDSPNHQIGRITDLNTRALVAMSANFGLMINPSMQTAEDLVIIKEAIQWYQANRQLIQFGDFYRLENPYTSNYGSWMFMDEEKSHGVVMLFQILSQASKPLKKIKLVGLASDKFYQVEGQRLSGEELMKFGLYLGHRLTGDFQAMKLEIHEVE